MDRTEGKLAQATKRIEFFLRKAEGKWTCAPLQPSANIAVFRKPLEHIHSYRCFVSPAAARPRPVTVIIDI